MNVARHGHKPWVYKKDFLYCSSDEESNSKVGLEVFFLSFCKNMEAEHSSSQVGPCHSLLRLISENSYIATYCAY